MSLLLLVLSCNFPVTAPPAPPAPPQLPGVMVGRLTLTDGRFTVFNDSETTWSSVVIQADGGANCNVGLVHPKDQAGLNITNCTGTVGPVVATASIRADQGTLSVSFSPPVAVGVGGITQPMPIDPSVATAFPSVPPGTTGSVGISGTPSPAGNYNYGGTPAATTGTTATGTATGSSGARTAGTQSATTGTGATTATSASERTTTTTAAPADSPSESTTRSTASAAPAASGGSSGGGTMKARATMSGGFGPARRLTVRNTSDFDWTGCKVTLNGTYFYNMKDVPASTDEGIMVYKFKDAKSTPLTNNAEITQVNVSCSQGSTTVTPS